MLKNFIMSAYQYATARERRAIAKRLTDHQNWPAAVLFYHRVADVGCLNGWSISSKDFRDHLDWLESHSTVVSLHHIQKTQVSGNRSSLEVALTFDDGYADNLLFALPEIVRRRLPCTYFVSTYHIEGGVEFPHDRKLKTGFKPNSVEEIQEIARSGIEIGGHSGSHVDLGAIHDLKELRFEIADSRKRLQDWCQQSIDYFSFPYGRPANISQAAIEVVHEAGYRGFVSANGNWNWPLGSDFHLERIHGDPGLHRIVNWLSLDPRKLESGPSIHFRDPRFSPSPSAPLRVFPPMVSDLNSPSVESNYSH